MEDFIGRDAFHSLYGYYDLDCNDVDSFPNAREIMRAQIENHELFKEEFNGPMPCEDCGGHTENSLFPCLPYNCPNFREGFECSAACHNNTCKNRRLTKGDYNDIMQLGASNTNLNSFGIFAKDNATKGSMIGEFIGVLKVGGEMPAEYCIPIAERFNDGGQPRLYLDASVEGNMARFMRSSCHSNCKYTTLICQKMYRVGIIATRSILKDEELLVENPRQSLDGLKCGRKSKLHAVTELKVSYEGASGQNWCPVQS